MITLLDRFGITKRVVVIFFVLLIAAVWILKLPFLAGDTR